MDYQVDALTRFMTAGQSADAIARVPELIAMARDVGMMVIHVIVAFRPGHPEISPRNLGFSRLMANGMLVAGSEGAAIHPAAAAREPDTLGSTARWTPSGVGLEPTRQVEPSARLEFVDRAGRIGRGRIKRQRVHGAHVVEHDDADAPGGGSLEMRRMGS
jgi:hypothetical protein